MQSLFFLNPKIQASSHILWLYSPVCVGPGRKPRRPVFSERGSYDRPPLETLHRNNKKKTTCISSKVQSLGYDRLPKTTGRATIADDRVVFFSKNATLVSLVCDKGIFNPSEGFISAWPFMIQSMGRDLRKQNNYVCMYETGLGRGVNEQASSCVERKIRRSGRFRPRAPTLINLVYETIHSPMTRFFRCVSNAGILSIFLISYPVIC